MQTLLKSLNHTNESCQIYTTKSSYIDRSIHTVSIKLRFNTGTSLMAQWLLLDLPMQGVWILFLVRKLRLHMPRDQKAKTKAEIILQQIQ